MNAKGDRTRGRTAPIFQTVVSWLGLVASALLLGCANYQTDANAWLNDLRAGQTDRALQKIQAQSKETNQVLDAMNRGMVYRFQKNWDKSNEQFQLAITLSDQLRAISLSEQAGAVLLAESMRSYEGAFFEILSLPIFSAYNDIDKKDCTAARVEARRINELIRANNEPKKILPWAVFFSGLVYELLGENDNARVSYRQAKALYQGTADRQKMDAAVDAVDGVVPRVLQDSLAQLEDKPDSPQLDCADLGRQPAGWDKAELLVVYQHGWVSRPREQRLQINTGQHAAGIITLSLPAYGPSPVQAQATARLLPLGPTGAQDEWNLSLVADYEALARAELADNLPGMQARMLSRMVLRKVAARKAVEGSKNDSAKVFAGLLADVSLIATETADTRAWPLAPSAVYVGRKVVEPGRRRVRIQAGAFHWDTEVDLPAGKTVFLNVQPGFVSATK